jgi:hypothetical protein
LGWQASLAESDDEELVAEARARQLRDAVTLQQLARAQLARWIAKDPEGIPKLIHQLTPHQVARFWQTGFHLENELLPPVKPPEEVDISKKIKESEKEQAAQEKAKELDFAEIWTKLLRLLRRAGLRKERLEEKCAKLLRWLWLPEEVDFKNQPHPMATNAKKMAMIGTEGEADERAVCANALG